MMTLAAAAARRVAARERLAATLAETRDRLAPSALANEAVTNVKARANALAADGVAAVRSRPIALAAVVSLVGLVLARRPLVRWLGANDATPHSDAS